MGKLHCKIENKWCKFLIRKGICTYCDKNIKEISRCPRLSEIETVRFSELLKVVSFEDVFVALTKWFDNQEPAKDGYHEVFRKLCLMKPQKHELGDMFIDIHKVKEDDGSEWLDVSGKFPNKTITYGIEFCPWIEWVSMFITQTTLDMFTPEEIVGACLWEMTFYGFTEDKVDETKKELIKSVEDAKEALKNSSK